MAMTATITQVNNALPGQPTYFTVTISNSGATNVSLNALQPVVQNPLPTGAPSAMPCNIGIVTAPGTAPSVPVAGGPQFNIPIVAGSSITLSFPIQFFGPLISGTPTQPYSLFQVTANIQTSDGSVFSPIPVPVLALNAPTWGLAASSYGLAPPATGQLDFFTPVNTALGLSIGL